MNQTNTRITDILFYRLLPPLGDVLCQANKKRQIKGSAFGSFELRERREIGKNAQCVVEPELTGLVPCFLGELVDEVVDVVWDVGGDVVLFSVDSEGAIPDGFEECDDAFDRQAGTFLDGR